MYGQYSQRWSKMCEQYGQQWSIIAALICNIISCSTTTNNEGATNILYSGCYRLDERTN